MPEVTNAVWIPVIAALAGAVIGASALLLGQYFQWKRERRDRILARSEEAAALMLPIVDSLHVEFGIYWGQPVGPPQDAIYERFVELQRLSIDLIPDQARGKLRMAAEAFYYHHMISPGGPEDGYLPSQIGYKTAQDAHSVIGAIRRGENSVPDTPNLDDFAERILATAQLLEGQEHDE